jgi:hypothetical protein
MDTPQQTPMPKKACMVNLMFAIEDDKEALDVKQHIDAAIAAIKEKRYTFQIIET